MKICLVFDLDDTLYSEHQYVLSGFKAVSLFLKKEYGVVGFFNESCRLFNANQRGNIFNQSLDNLNVDSSDSFVKKLVNIYREHDPAIDLFNDAAWALDYFSKKIPLGLITDGYLVAQQNKINALNISDYFDSIVISDALGREFWKPHEKPYLTIQSEMNVAAEQCIYVGDNVSKDFITANCLGWRTIHILRNEGEYSDLNVSDSHKAQTSIASLRELQDEITL